MWSVSFVGDYRPRHPFWATSSCICESQGTDLVSAAVQVSPLSAHHIIRSSLNSHHIRWSFMLDFHSWEAFLWMPRRMYWNHLALLTLFEAYRSFYFQIGIAWTFVVEGEYKCIITKHQCPEKILMCWLYDQQQKEIKAAISFITYDADIFRN